MRRPSRLLGRLLMVAFPALLALGFCAMPQPAHAQAIRWEHPARDCDLAEKKWDGGLTMRRYQWHAFNATLSTITAEAIHRVTKAPRWASALSAFVIVGVAPHVINGAIRRQYAINPMDWAFDAFNDAAPVLLWTGASGGTWQSKTLAATTEIAGYSALACWSSP